MGIREGEIQNPNPETHVPNDVPDQKDRKREHRNNGEKLDHSGIEKDNSNAGKRIEKDTEEPEKKEGKKSEDTDRHTQHKKDGNELDRNSAINEDGSADNLKKENKVNPEGIKKEDASANDPKKVESAEALNEEVPDSPSKRHQKNGDDLEWNQKIETEDAGTDEKTGSDENPENAAQQIVNPEIPEENQKTDDPQLLAKDADLDLSEIAEEFPAKSDENRNNILDDSDIEIEIGDDVEFDSDRMPVQNELDLMNKQDELDDSEDSGLYDIRNSPVENEGVGKWVNGERGNGKFVPDPDYVPPERKGRTVINPDHLTASEILGKYGIDGIEYIGGNPIFDPVSKANVPVKELSDNRQANFNQADREYAESIGATPEEVAAWRKANNYTWHECRGLDGNYVMQLVPNEIHGWFTHRGAISQIKNAK